MDRDVPEKLDCRMPWAQPSEDFGPAAGHPPLMLLRKKSVFSERRFQLGDPRRIRSTCGQSRSPVKAALLLELVTGREDRGLVGNRGALEAFKSRKAWGPSKGYPSTRSAPHTMDLLRCWLDCLYQPPRRSSFLIQLMHSWELLCLCLRVWPTQSMLSR